MRSLNDMLKESIFDIDDNIDNVEYAKTFGMKYTLSIGDISSYQSNLTPREHNRSFKKMFDISELRKITKSMHVSKFAEEIEDRFGKTLKLFIIFLENQEIEPLNNIKQDFKDIRKSVIDSKILSEYAIDIAEQYINDNNCIFLSNYHVNSFYILTIDGSPLEIVIKKR